ncbi:hypothetical protein R1sor_019191 [Riccia sorocarpa]|uniref:Fanconi anemia group D2 protein n=1 Tax=Riccia sorocarpa TaxID=122646 RepID=A0ABD3IDJ3_9MARC
MTAGVVDSRKRSTPSDSTTVGPSPVRRRQTQSTQTQRDAFLSVLASAACLLREPGPPVIACDSRNVIVHLEQRLKADAELAGRFLECFQNFIADESNFRRTLLPMITGGRNGNSRSCESLARVLLSVSPIQSSVASTLLEKLPEYVGEDEDGSLGLQALMDSIPRLILSQFRWLEYVVDSRTLTTKLLEVLTICPLSLKKEIISFLPELIVDADHEMVVQSLEGMLQDDTQLIVPILDAFSSFNLDEVLFEQVVSLALSSLRSADSEDLPLVVKFLLQSATPTNVKQVVQQLRENLQFVTVADVRMSKPDRKQKGKSPTTNCEALVLEAIRSGLRFQNQLVLEAVLKEIRDVEGNENHRVVDIWLLLIIHLNGGPHRKTAQQLLFKKVSRGDIGQSLLRQSIQGRGDSLQDYFQTLVSVSEFCLRSTDRVAKQFGMHTLELLFEEFAETYYRQEVLGSLITLTGSGISHEVGSALDTLLLLATKQADKLLPISSFINGVLDSLEGFEDMHLHQVYRIFSHLAVTAWSSTGSSSGSSVASELLIIVRKQISSPDTKYKRMGIIGGVGLASCLCHHINTESEMEEEHPQRSSAEEAVFLLQTTLDACKSSAVSRAFFYDELTAQAETNPFSGPIMNWISKHTNEFETLYLGDLENGQLQAASNQTSLIEGEIWMNLDGEVSPIILNVLPMLTGTDKSLRQALLFLPASFRLLSAVERLVNQGSLGSIDALLGCPIYLPKHQINAFSTQLEGRLEDLITQTTREETVGKLCKRVRNLMFLECCLGECLASVNVSLPCLHSAYNDKVQPKAETKPPSDAKKPPGKRGRKKKVDKAADANGSQRADEAAGGGGRQQTIRDAFSRLLGTNGAKSSQAEAEAEETQAHPSQAGASQRDVNNRKPISVESLDEQRWKFRPFTISSTALLTVQVPQDSCCPDAAAMLPVYLYLLQDLQLKMDACLGGPARKLAPWMQASPQPKVPSGIDGMSGISMLKKIAGTFSSLRKHLECSKAVLQSDADAGTEQSQEKPCGKHWEKESIAASNPPDERFDVPSKEAAQSVFLVVAFSELTVSENFPLLKDFLLAFKSTEPVNPDIARSLAPGSMEEAFCQAYAYLDGLAESAIGTSITAATELVMTLKALVSCAQAFVEKSTDDPRQRTLNTRSSEILPYLRARLSSSAATMLGSDWDADDWKKTKGDMLQQMLRMQIQNSECPVHHLEELACTALPQVPSKNSKSKLGVEGYPALSPVTFMTWYRVLMKDIQAKCKSKVSLSSDTVIKVLEDVQQCTTVHVALVNLTKTHEKVRDLQKATRIIQTLCSDAKGQKRMPVTCKVPLVKRSMERFVFCIKALLHGTSHGDSFWMGNLKHKDLHGHEISSQLYVDEAEEDAEEEQEASEPELEDEIGHISDEEEVEAPEAEANT